jgi:hypothetical protein
VIAKQALSFRAGEEVDSETLAKIEERVCNALGFADHQRISVVHHDTDNLHMHIAINRAPLAQSNSRTPNSISWFRTIIKLHPIGHRCR